MEFTNTLKERLFKIAPAQFGHHIEHGYMHPRIKPVVPEMKLAGPAWTVRATERDGSALYYAVMKAPKGAVIVVDRGREDIFAIAGDQLVLMMQHRELGGLVIDGPATDRLGLSRLGFPVFCTGFSPVTTLCKGTNGEVQVPIECGGAVVHPGDIILGDADGAIALSPEMLTEELISAAESMTASELRRAERITTEGYRFLKREDVDIEKFFEYDKAALIAKIKQECQYSET